MVDMPLDILCGRKGPYLGAILIHFVPLFGIEETTGYT
jgi:hypothetical protein